jgi:hypothetical protein
MKRGDVGSVIEASPVGESTDAGIVAAVAPPLDIAAVETPLPEVPDCRDPNHGLTR